MTINAIVGDNGLIYQAKNSKDAASNEIASKEGSMNDMLAEYANVMAEDKEIPISGPQETPEPEEGGSEFIMSYGIIEIKWLDGNTNYVNSKPNAPKIKNIDNGSMELVKYDEESKSWIAGTEYSYVSTTGDGDNNASKWANARITINGIESYFVWIPRYAYRIIYFNSEASKQEYKNEEINEEEAIERGKIVGYSDSRGIVDKEGRKVTTVASTTKPMVSKEYFMVHPAFTSDVNVGGFGEELEGIWIGKYETSLVDTTTNEYVNTDSETEGNILLSDTQNRAIAVQPNMRSWRSITIGKMYANAKEYSQELESHMLKNSEWGAVAYLTESVYGRNGTEVTKNNSSNGATGNAGDSLNTGQEPGITNEYNTAKGVLASSTGNVYGIYDLSGGAWEYTAGYYNGENVDKICISNGSTFAGIGKASDKYSTAYNSNDNSSTNSSQNYIYGDATYETRGWHNDYSEFIFSPWPFFYRGGGSNDDASAGIFHYGCFEGTVRASHSFRICLCI